VLQGVELDQQNLFYSESFDTIRDRMDKEWGEVSPKEEAVHSSLTELQNSESAALGRLTQAIKIRHGIDRSELASNFKTVSRQLVWKLDRVLSP
jgi:hypothetical protein